MTKSESKEVCDFFAPGNNILDFSPKAFVAFSATKIGEAIGLSDDVSLGAAFRCFVNESTDVSKKLCLLQHLVEYYENRYPDKASGDSPRGVAFRRVRMIVVEAIGSGVALAPRSLLLGDKETSHLKDSIELALDAVARRDFSSALTKAKSALEGTLKYALRKSRGETKGFKDIPELLGLIRIDYGIPRGEGVPKQLNQFYTGISTTIGSIAEIRNAAADSHGRADPASEISDIHARLYVNISAALCEYVMSLVHEKEASNDNA